MKKAFLSALGNMGRRHLRGLIQAGFEVYGLDIRGKAEVLARRDINNLGKDQSVLRIVREIPTGINFDVAIFAETTPGRLNNFSRFVSKSTAQRILLEKPLAADPNEVQKFSDLANERGMIDRIQVNFIRRLWPHVQKLVERCQGEQRISVTINGGAVGLGCMGIHYLDTFLALCGDEKPDVNWVELSQMRVASGRGVQFEDYGGDFVLSTSRARLHASLEADSSANVLMTVRGSHFLAHVDYSSLWWKIAERNPDSVLPNYRYGADYKIVEDSRIEIPSMDRITHDWALGKCLLTNLEDALLVHEILDQIIQRGGIQPPYHYT